MKTARPRIARSRTARSRTARSRTARSRTARSRTARSLFAAVAIMMMVVAGRPALTTDPAQPDINLGSTDMASLANAFAMDGVAGFIEGRARERLKAELVRHGPDWIADAVAHALNIKRAEDMPEHIVFRQNPALKAAVQAELKKRIKEWLPGQIKELVSNRLFGMVLEKESLEEARSIAERAMKEIDTSLNDRIDGIVGGMYDETVARFGNFGREYLFGNWIDPTDIKGSIKRASQLDRIGDAFAGQLGSVVGDSTVASIRGRITDALDGQLPPELIGALQRGPDEFEKYVAKAERYFPGRALRGLTGSILNRPVLKLPTPAYAAILAASAAGHFTKAFKGVFVDAYELKRGIEVTRVMIWQLRNKEWINLSIMQLGSLARGIAGQFGAAGAIDGLAQKIRAPLDRIQRMADDIDKMMLKPIEQVRKGLKETVGQIKDELSRLQDEIVGPLRDAVDEAREGLKEAGQTIADSLPEEFNGIPPSWEDLKKRAGLEDGILGEVGKWRPRDAIDELAKRTGLDEAAKKIKKDFEKVNDAIADKLAKAAAEALEALHLLGPAARILEVEKVPAQNESESDELDPVLLHNGEFVHSVTDVVIPGRGLDFRLTRTYRGHGKFLGEFGFGWTHSYAERLLRWNDGSGDGFTHIDGEGRKFFFRRDGDGFISPPGTYAHLTCTVPSPTPLPGLPAEVSVAGGERAKGEGENCEIHERDGSVSIFGAQGRLTQRRDRWGNRIELIYNEAGLVDSVIDPFGRRVSIERRKDGLISRITDFAGRSFSYEYNDERELAKVTSPATPDFPKGKATAYRYVRTDADSPQAHAISMIMDPKGGVYLKMRYDEEGRAIAQSYGGGPWMTVAYAAYAAESQGDVASRAWVTDAGGITRLYEHDSEGRLLRKWRYDAPDYALLISYQYDGAGNRISTCMPSGRCAVFKYGEGESDGEVVGVEIYPAGGGGLRALDMGEPADKKRYAYNGCGQVIEEVDARGVVTAYEYYPSSDPDGDGVAVADGGVPGGGQDCGYLKKIMKDARDDPQRRAEGRPLMRSTEFAYDPIGNINAEKGPDGAILHLGVNALNQVTGEKRPGLAPISYAFDANDNVVRMVAGGDDGKIAQEFEYGPLDRIEVRRERISEQGSIEAHYAYDPAGNLVRVTHPEGNADDYEYDAEGRIVCEVRGSNSIERSRECVERDEDGEIMAVIDGEGMRTKFIRDGFGDIIERIDPLGNRVKYGRDAEGRIVSERFHDAEGRLLSEAAFSYDEEDRAMARKRRLWRDNPERSSWIEERLEYDASGDVIAGISASGARMEYKRDGAGDVVLEIGPSGARRHYVRDASGHIIESFIEAGGERFEPAKFEYDEAGRITAAEAGKGMWSYGYDGLGNLISVLDPWGAETRYEIDGLGRVTAMVRDVRGLKVTTRYGWNGNGKLTSLTDPNGNSTRFAFDAQDRLTVERYTDGTERRTAYDRRRLVAASVDRNGSILRIDRDALGRIRSRRASPAAGVIGTTEQRFEYDGMGRIVNAADFNDPADENDDVITSFVYDSLSRPLAESQDGRWITREFDEEGNAVSMRLPSGERFYFTPGIGGRLDSIVGSGGAIVAFEYDAIGNAAGRRLGEKMRVVSRRDKSGRPEELRYENDAGVWIAGSKISYDGGGRVAVETSYAGITREYSRDSLGRLSEVREGESYYGTGDEAPRRRLWRYDYDQAGNLKTALEERDFLEFSTNGLNEYTRLVHRFMSVDGSHVLDDDREPTDEFRYDADGNLISDSTLQLGPRQYRYDAFGRLAGIWRGRDAYVGHTKFVYDAFGRLVAEGGGATGGEEIDRHQEYIWDGWRMVEEMRMGKRRAAYVYDDGLGTPLAAVMDEGVRYILTDRLGSMIAAAAEGGEIIARCDYGPRGQPIAVMFSERSSHELDENIGGTCIESTVNFGFAGHPYDYGQDLSYMRNRFYSVKLGRFITPDPLGYKMAFDAPRPAASAPMLSFHRMQGGASRATFPNRPLAASATYDAYPFGRFFAEGGAGFDPGETNLYLYGRGDPSTFVDPLGLADLLFDRSENKLYLYDGRGFIIRQLDASNAPTMANGTYPFGVPEFYSDEYRTEFYQQFLRGNNPVVLPGESRADSNYYAGRRGGQPYYHWRGRNETDGRGRVKHNYNQSQGQIRFQIVGNYFFHGGRDGNFMARTQGCIRGADAQLTTLATDSIEFRRRGDPITTITVQD